MKTILTSFAALGIAGCAVNVHEQASTPPPPAQPSAQEIVAARQAAFHLMGAAMGNMRGAIERGGDVSGQAYAARGVARWARAIPAMFPEGTAAVTPTRARPEIWGNKADFNAKALALAAAATRLAELAEAKDKAGFAAQHKATGATCGACHDAYQVPQRQGG